MAFSFCFLPDICSVSRTAVGFLFFQFYLFSGEGYMTNKKGG